MRAPITFIHGNCVFGGNLNDCWAAFALAPASYLWLSEGAKHHRLACIREALERVEADLQILRVSARWDSEDYGREQIAELEAGLQSDQQAASGRLYVQRQVEQLAQSAGMFRAATFLLVSLRNPERDVASFVANALEQRPGQWLRAIRRALQPRGLLSATELERVSEQARRTHSRLADLLEIEPARTAQLQWLVRRAYCRGLGEPMVDALHEPRALLFERNGEALLAPLEGELLRWLDGYVEPRGRSLRIESELGTSWQAHLVLGALPESAPFPGSPVELMFAPVESLPFGVDLSLNARYLPNELALRLARRRIQDADQIARAELDGEQGVSDQGYERTQQARDLLRHLQSSRRPPLLRATLTIAVGASSQEQLAERIEMCRRAYGETRLYCPLGDQLELFQQHLPGQRTRVVGYDDTLTSK